MNKIIKTTVSLFSALAVLTACSTDNSGKTLITGNVPEDQIPMALNLPYPKDEDKDLKNIKAASPVKSFQGIDGETLSVESAYDIVEPGADTSSYIFLYDFAYIQYAAPIYDSDSSETEKAIPYMYLDSSDSVNEFKEYLNSHSTNYKIKRGDKLNNGLVCTDAVSRFDVSGENAELVDTIASFSGEITLTGTVCRYQDEILGEESLCFFPDSKNGNVISGYDVVTDSKNVELGSKYPIFERFVLDNAPDVLEKYASIIGDSEYVNVSVTLKDICLSHWGSKTNLGSSAAVVDMKAV